MLPYFVHYCLFEHINCLVIQGKSWKFLGISENPNKRQYKGSPYSQHFLVLSCLFWSATHLVSSPASFLWDAHADITFLYLDTIVFLINRFPIYTFGTFAFLSDRNLTDIGKNTVNAITMGPTSFWSPSKIFSYQPIWG